MGNLGFVVSMVSFERGERRQAGENRVERGQKQQIGERGRKPAQRCPRDLTAFQRFWRVIPVPEYLRPTRVRFLVLVGVGTAPVTNCCHGLVSHLRGREVSA